MNFKKFIELYDNWNGTLKVNDDNLDCIAKDRVGDIMETRHDLYEKEVVAFGFYNNELCVRIKYNSCLSGGNKNMDNYKEFESMVSYGFHYKCRKFYTGKQIKDVIMRCISDETIFIYRRKELEAFADKYINSKYPLADNTLYSLSWCGEEMDELKCYKKP